MTAKVASLPARKGSLQLLFLLAYIVLVGVYWSARFAGSATDGDSALVTKAAAGMASTGKLLYPFAYHAGYTFSAVLSFASSITGLPVQLIQLGSALWLVAVGLAAYIAYRELLGRPQIAVLAVFLLFIQPDFLFYLLRPSHEKTTWLYALLLLFLTVRSYRFARQPARLIAYLLLFYLVFYALASTNNLFASSFAAALGMSFVGGWVLSLRNKKWGDAGEGKHHSRLLFTAILCLLTVFILMEYIYPLARNIYALVYDMTSRTSALFLGAQPAEPYTYVESAWLTPWVYLALTTPQWLINLAAFAFWGIGFWRMDFGGIDLGGVEASKRGLWLLWLMYAAFGIQLAASLIIDLAGFLSTNLQVRQFTPFTLLSSPVAALALWRLGEKLSFTWRRALRPAGAALAMAAVALAMMKVTNDPLLGNYWLFYTPAERQAVVWADDNISGQRVWLDVAGQLRNVTVFWQEYGWDVNNSYESGASSDPPPYILVSRITQLRANRSGNALPYVTTGHQQVYDNGDVKIFFRRARTPFQR